MKSTHSIQLSGLKIQLGILNATMNRVFYTFDAVTNHIIMKTSTKTSMLPAILAVCTMLMSIAMVSQNTISGTAVQKNGEPIMGANVYLEGTYDGASTDDAGKFSFQTTEEGIQTLVISYVTYQPFYMAAHISQMQDLQLTLKEDLNALDTVIISAGTLEASDNSKVSVLKPLDVVTTASALGDFVGRFDNRRCQFRGQFAQVPVNLGAGGLEMAEGVNDFDGDATLGDGEVFDGALRAGTPEGVGGHLHVAH